MSPTHLTERLQATTTSWVSQAAKGGGGGQMKVVGGFKGEEAHPLGFNGFECQKKISVWAIGVYGLVCVCM